MHKTIEHIIELMPVLAVAALCCAGCADFRAGCIGTMTIRGDGSDGIYDKTVTENLCLPYKEEAGRK